MGSRRAIEEQQLLHQQQQHHYHSSSSTSSGSVRDEDSASEYELDADVGQEKVTAQHRVSRLPRWLPAWSARARRRAGSTAAYFAVAPGRRRRGCAMRTLHVFALVPYMVVGLVIIFGVFLPSYSHPPQRYAELQTRVEASKDLGRGNVRNEKVFIATSLYDKEGELLSGVWGEKLRELVEILGPENVHLSIYENDPDEKAALALRDFGDSITSNKSIVSEHLDLAPIPHVITPNGVSRLKRIAFLAEVRNRALRPLEDPTSSAYASKFDKLLYVNDVAFDPTDAANLLFSTNADHSTGTTDYRAACAVDFINPFKFYDTFATRDTEGYQMGVPFYPWFTASGSSTSRNDVLSQKDAVRVKSCWGGMVAFEARWFQPHVHTSFPTSSPLANITAPALRFRAEPDTYWDGSECCLIHADLTALSPPPTSISPSSSEAGETTGIYMNPYIRVAYSHPVLRWLSFTRRFERLYSPIHHLINTLASRPGFNPRRLQQPGDKVLDRVWVWDEASKEMLKKGGQLDRSSLHGQFEEVERVATPGQFCGFRNLLYINEEPVEGEEKWGFEEVPLS